MTTTTTEGSHAQAGARKARPTPLTTVQAAQVVLGGTDTATFWGRSFQDLAGVIEQSMLRHIGYPLEAPWRKVLDFTAADFAELEVARIKLDNCREAAARIDEQLAKQFVRRCAVVGLHAENHADLVAKSLEIYGFEQFDLAEPARISVAIAYGVPLRFFTDLALFNAPIPGSALTPRTLLQLWTNEVCRSVDEAVWARRTLLRIACSMMDLDVRARFAPRTIYSMGGLRVCIPVVATAGEADFLRSIGGRLVRIAETSSATLQVSPYPTDIVLATEAGGLIGSDEFLSQAVQVLAEATGTEQR
jgi:hypothetical protein